MGQIYFDDIETGAVLHELDKGPITTAHIVRWSAAIENWHRIHYDLPFATGHEKLPGVIINGSWKQHVLVQLVKEALGPGGWLWKLKFRYKAMDLAGDSIRAEARVVGKRAIGELGFVTLEVALIKQGGEVSTAGRAIGVLPCRSGARVPYPFVSKPEYAAVEMPNDA